MPTNTNEYKLILMEWASIWQIKIQTQIFNYKWWSSYKLGFKPINLLDFLTHVKPQVSCSCPRKTRSSAGRSTTSSSSPLLDFSGAKTHFCLIFIPEWQISKFCPFFDGYIHIWRLQKLTSQEWWLCPLHWRSDGWVRNTWLGRWPANSRNSWWDPVLMLKY